MGTARRSRTIAAPAEELWEVIRDPHHLPRWWPRVARVEGVEEGEFTEVLKTAKGKIVRADFNVIARDDIEHSLTWAQQVEGTPFARVLKSAETEIVLTDVRASDGPATEVTIELRQTLQGSLPTNRRSAGTSGRFSLRVSGIARLGSPLVSRAAVSTVNAALDGLERIGG
jgi:uncharacterized protein YndB with AHSA1/START domain